MRQFRVPSFTGIQAHRDDADRGSLRVAEGCVPSGPGGLRSSPIFQNVGTVSIYSPDSNNYLSGATDANGNSVLFSSRAQEVKDLRVNPVANTDLVSLGSTYNVVVPISLGSSIYPDRPCTLSSIGNNEIAWGDGSAEASTVGIHATLPQYSAFIAGNWILALQTKPSRGLVAGQKYEITLVQPDGVHAMTTGGGVGIHISHENLQWEYTTAPSIPGRVAEPDDELYHREYARFPNCRYFVVGPKKTIFAAGNPDEPLTVYISEPADIQTPYRDALYTDKGLSKVRILMSDGHEITALSGGRDHVVVHTDGGAHLLQPPQDNQASTGYRVEQAPLTAASASVNHDVVGGEIGSYPFWTGFDGEIYKDESGTRGPDAKDAYADPDQVSWMAKGRWNKELPTDLSQSFATYNSELGYYILYVENTEYEAWLNAGSPTSWAPPSKYKAYIYSELAKSLSGPFVNNDITAITSIRNSSQVLAVNKNYEVLRADLDHFRDRDFPLVSDPWPDTTSVPTGRFIAADSEGAFLYRGKYLASPFADSVQGTGALNSPMYFADANLAIVETAWMHFSDESSEKQVHSVSLNFSNNSVGRVWAYVESDTGLVSGQYKGTIQPKMKVFTNIRGVRFRVRMFVAAHEQHPWNLREMVMGYLQGQDV